MVKSLLNLVLSRFSRRDRPARLRALRDESASPALERWVVAVEATQVLVQGGREAPSKSVP